MNANGHMSTYETKGIALWAGVLLGTVAALSSCTPSYRANIDYLESGEIVWPGPPEKPRIKYLWSLNSFLPEGMDLADYFLGSVVDAKDTVFMPYLMRPYGLSVDLDGRLYIVDQGGPRITAVNLASKEVHHFGYRGSDALVMPVGIATDASGKVYVTDSGARRVNVYDRTGKFLSPLGKEGFFTRPTGIAVDRGTGRILVLDTAGHKVHVFANSGDYLFGFGARGSGEKEFNYPTHIAVGDDGKIYVNDAMNFRIQIFERDGSCPRDGVVRYSRSEFGEGGHRAWYNDHRIELVTARAHLGSYI